MSIISQYNWGGGEKRDRKNGLKVKFPGVMLKKPQFIREMITITVNSKVSAM